MTSTISDAVQAIEQFEQRNSTSPWKLTGSEVASRLKELVRNPTLVNQGNLNLCGPAATFVLWSSRDPLAFAQYGIELFERGESRVGNISVKPGSNLLNQNYSAVLPRMSPVCPQAEWMMMSALRDSENAALDFEGTPDDTTSGITMPGEIKEWLTAIGCYSSVMNEGNFVVNAGLDHAAKLKSDDQQDVVMLINANILPRAQRTPFDLIAQFFPNHYIVLNSAIKFSDSKVVVDHWTWGGVESEEVDKADFDDNYYGAIIASL